MIKYLPSLLYSSIDFQTNTQITIKIVRIVSNIMGKSVPSSPLLIYPKCLPNLHKKIAVHATVRMVNSTAKIIFIRNIFYHLPYILYGSKMKYLLAGCTD